MAKFVKGDYVQITPRPDYSWEHWTEAHTNLCDKICRVVKVTEGDWVGEVYVEVEYRGTRVWFRDNQMIKVKKSNEIYDDVLKEAIHNLNKREDMFKKMRDEILEDIFGEPRKEETDKLIEEPAIDPDPDDQFFDDWEEQTTKDIIPLPGRDPVTEEDPKAQSSGDDPKSKKTKFSKSKMRKLKSLGKKKKLYSSPGAGTWVLSDEDMEELEKFIDSLPTLNDADSTDDFDFEYFFGEHDHGD